LNDGSRAGAVDAPFLAAGARLRDGRYVLEHALGRGGMAAVWLARDERLERLVAIKVLSDALAGDGGYLERFQREARVAAGLNHPNLVGVYDFGAERGRPFLVMEYVGGGDLAGRIAEGRLPDADRLARELLDALRHIHAAGVIHRDVKAQNVLIGDDGRARLTDFGIAQPRDATSLTQTGMVVGTARYLAPEVLGGGAPSERSDLYSLGVVLEQVTEGRGGGAGLLRLVDALTSPDPAERPGSAKRALAMLERPAVPPIDATEPIAATERPPAPRPAPAPGPRSGRRDLRKPLAVAGLAALALAVAAIVVLAGGGESEPGGSQTAAQREDPGAAAGEGSGGEASSGGAQEPAAPASEDPEPDGAPDAPSGDGYELNDEGYALIQDGRPEEAIPVLERAVDALEGTGDLTYAYALYNLGHALRLAGRPEEAIPILEARLEIPNQSGVVRQELAAAREAAD